MTFFFENTSGGNAFGTFNLPKISCLFDNNLSPGVGGAPSRKLYLKNGRVEHFLNGGGGSSTVK
jgi:hypothetical protein